MTEFLLAHIGAIVAAVLVVAAFALHRFVLRLFGMVVIPEDSIGIVTKKFVLFGENRSLPDGSVVALNGEAGVQADSLAPGVHFGLWPWQYEIEIEKFITIERGKLGIVTSRDGRAVSGGRVLGKTVECDSFQNARAFLTSGGERGPQLAIIPPGTYRINTGLFDIRVADALEIADNKVGVVTTKEGQPLDAGDIAGPAIPNHNMYQDPQAFLTGGGRKGLQEQVILAGRYYINPLFATVEEVPMTEVPMLASSLPSSASQALTSPVKGSSTATWWVGARRTSGPNRSTRVAIRSTRTLTRSRTCQLPTSS